MIQVLAIVTNSILPNILVLLLLATIIALFVWVVFKFAKAGTGVVWGVLSWLLSSLAAFFVLWVVLEFIMRQ